MRGRRRERSVRELVSGALEDLGVASAPVSAAVAGAWARAAEPAWKPHARPARLQGGVLEVAVSSAALREELAQFHAARLLTVLRAALPDMTLAGLRFVAAAAEPAR